MDRAILQPTSWRTAAISAVVLVALTALVVSPEMALVALLPAAAIVITRRLAVAGAAALLVVAAIGARMVQRQLAGRYPANAAWPGIWEKLHGPGLLVVTLLLTAALLARDSER